MQINEENDDEETENMTANEPLSEKEANKIKSLNEHTLNSIGLKLKSDHLDPDKHNGFTGFVLQGQSSGAQSSLGGSPRREDLQPQDQSK